MQTLTSKLNKSLLHDTGTHLHPAASLLQSASEQRREPREKIMNYKALLVKSHSVEQRHNSESLCLIKTVPQCLGQKRHQRFKAGYKKSLDLKQKESSQGHKCSYRPSFAEGVVLF